MRPRITRNRTASRRCEPPLRSGTRVGLCPLRSNPCFPSVPVRAHEPRRERRCSLGRHDHRHCRAGGVHLVASARDDDVAHSSLVQLVHQLELLAPRPLYREATCVFCDRCRRSVDTASSTQTVTTTPTTATSTAPTAGGSCSSAHACAEPSRCGRTVHELLTDKARSHPAKCPSVPCYRRLPLLPHSIS